MLARGCPSRQVWDAGTGQPLTSPLRHGGRVLTAVFSPNGRQILTASWGRAARVWNEMSGQLTPAAEEGFAQLWDAATGRTVGQPMKHRNMVTQAAFSPD